MRPGWATTLHAQSDLDDQLNFVLICFVSDLSYKVHAYLILFLKCFSFSNDPFPNELHIKCLVT